MTGESSRHTLAETLAVFDRTDAPGAPLTTSEVAEELGCARRTAYGKLETLADRGDVETKKVGARGRVWWRSPGAFDGSAAAPDAGVDGGSDLQRAQFQELVGEVTDYAIFALDADGVVRTWNEGVRQLKGYEAEEIVGEHFSQFYTEEDRESGRPERNLAVAREQGRVEDEGWRVRQDGTRFWANVTITPLRDDGGAIQGYLKVTRDMTERHEYEQRIREQKERFEALVREVTDYAIFLLDTDGVVQTWNEGARQLKGYEAEEIVGEHFSQFYTEEDREAGRPERNLAVAREQGRVEDEGWRVRQDGTRFWANVTITALRDDGDLRGFAKVTRDMTERHEYEQRLREQRDELDELAQINEVIRGIDQALVTATSREEVEQAVCDRLAASETYAGAWTVEFDGGDADPTPRSWAGVGDDYVAAIRDENLDAEESAVVDSAATALETRSVQHVQDLAVGADDESGFTPAAPGEDASAVAVPLVYDDVEYGVLTVSADHASAFDQRKTAVLGELGETVSHAIAAIRRKEREQTLTTLQESTRELLHAETRAEIGDVIAETLTSDLALADALVYGFDTTENALELVSAPTPRSPAGPPDRLTTAADSPVWQSFVDGETRVDAAALPGNDGPAMVVPLGDHGVLAVAAPTDGSLDDDTRNLVELVAATAEAAFDRVESQATLREREELLQEQNQRLQRLNQVNTVIRAVDRGLVGARTHDEIRRVVCDRLTDSDRFRFAWVGTRGDDEETLTPQAWSGDGRGYLDSVDLSPGHGTDEPAVTAARTGTVAVVSNVAEDLREGEWRTEAFSREFQSVVSVPLSYGDVTYGVLTVYADRPDVFGEMERTVFAELADTVASAMDAVDTKQALFSGQTVELELRVREASGSFLDWLARELDCELELEGAIPLTDERARLFFLARGADVDALRDVLESSVAAESSRVVAARDGGHLVEAVVSDRTVPTTLLEHNASVHALTTAGDGLELVVDLPSGTAVRGFVEQFRAAHGDVELVARRERDRRVETPDGLYADLEEAMTDRQLEVLETAYYSGFFSSPRESTGGDVAELLDVSQPTVTEQLRTAQRKLLDLLLDDGVGG